jgi:CPA2 family monovalent cation:H+ antiporter-2
VHRYRGSRYRDILPERAEYWGASSLESVLEGLQRDWYVVPPHSPILGLTLAEARVRRLTGATVMAIERDKKLYQYPTGDAVMELGDRLLVVGSDREREAFLSLLEETAE